MTLLGALSAVTLLDAVPLPPPDPLGYPLPPVMIQVLAWLTLALHFLAVNFTLGGLLLLLWIRIRNRDELTSARKFLTTALPLGFSYLVTLGIPPLLFVQVLYGQMFYSSSAVIGAWWILVIPLLISAYGLLYLHKLKEDARPRVKLIHLAFAAVAMLLVGFIYVNNLTLAQTPDRWMDIYSANPAGSSLNWGEAILFPRYLLFMSPTLVVGGLALILAGAYIKNGGPAMQLGFRAYIIGRVIMAVAGAWLIAVLPERIRDLVFEGGAPTVHLTAGCGLALVAAVLAAAAYKKRSLRLGVVSAAVMLVEALSFVGLRDQVRIAYLADYFKMEEVPVHEQWGMFTLFAVTMVAGLAFLIVMTVKVSSNAVRKAAEQV